MSLQPRILIVEDEETLAQNVRDYLCKRMIEARIVASGEAALECVADFGPDLLVLDYGLPGIDGLQTFAALKAEQADLGGVLITGHPTEQVLRAATEAGIRHVLAKPFAFSDLERLIRASLPPILQSAQASGIEEVLEEPFSLSAPERTLFARAEGRANRRLAERRVTERRQVKRRDPGERRRNTRS